MNAKPAAKLSPRPPPRGDPVKSLKPLVKSPEVVLFALSGLLDGSGLSNASNGSGLSGLSVMRGSGVSELGARSALGMTAGITLGTSEDSLGADGVPGGVADGVPGVDAGGVPEGETGWVPGEAGVSSSRAGAGRTVSHWQQRNAPIILQQVFHSIECFIGMCIIDRRTGCRGQGGSRADSWGKNDFP